MVYKLLHIVLIYPFFVYSTDSSANCAVKCLTFAYGTFSSPCGCSDDLRAAKFDHFASKPETT